jgi:hypothetical protein
MSGSQNPSAFPRDDYQTDDAPGQRGMTLRDWFAGQALTGLLASEAGIQPYPNVWAAERAYLLADALLTERVKGEDR